jgi:hypothetical protein
VFKEGLAMTDLVTGVGRDLFPMVDRVVVAADDGDGYVLGRPDLGVYVVVPHPGAVLVQALQAGEPVAAATARASAAAGTPVDGEEFLAGLAAAGLLAPPGGPDDAVASAGDAPAGREIRWIAGVSPAAARRLFGPAAWAGYALAAGFVVAALVASPELWPSYEHIWWLPDPVLSVLALFAVAVALGACHEAWHWLAGRAVGVPAIFRISYRGIFLVFETDLTQIVTTPRRKRYGPFLAGMAFDAVTVAVALGLRLAHHHSLLVLPGWADRLLAAIILVQLVGILWQWAALVMRSDGYAVLANALRCHDLYRATWLTSKQRLWRLAGAENAELSAISEHDRKVASWFGLLFLAGVIGMGWMAVSYAVPFLLSMLGWVGHSLTHPAPTSLAFWEAIAVTAVVVGQYAAVPALAWRERRLRRRGALR